jgi:hypothetical protein
MHAGFRVSDRRRYTRNRAQATENVREAGFKVPIPSRFLFADHPKVMTTRVSKGCG